jgi:integrase
MANENPTGAGAAERLTTADQDDRDQAPAVLRDHLMDRRLAAPDASDEALVFGVTARVPFQATVVYRRADKASGKAGLRRLRLHQARHTYASFMIAAGVNAKALSPSWGIPQSRSRSTFTGT